MDFTEKRRVKNPEISANPVSKFLFLWFTPLLVKGSKKSLELDDLYDRLPEDDASTLGDKMQRLWEQEKQNAKVSGKKPSFVKMSMRFFGIHFFYMTAYVLINELVFKLCQPFVLRAMIRSFSASERDKSEIRNEQYLYTAALISTTLIYALNLHQIFKAIPHMAMKGRIAASSLIYRKIFTLSKGVQSEKASIGKLVNLIGSDSNRFDHCFFHVNALISSPLQMIILSYFLYEELGVACFAGIGLIVGILIPFQVVVGRFSTKYRAQVAQRTDERGRMIGEIIYAIRTIKLYAWEKSFINVISKLRKYEILPIRKASYLRGAFQSLNALAKQTVPFFTFIAYISFGHSLTSDKAYFTISVFSILIMAMAQKIPLAVAQTAELLVALRRIEEFLLLEELEPHKYLTNKISQNIIQSDKHKPSILLESVNARWTDERNTLQNLCIDVKGNKLVIVCGPVGSGKSTLLNLLISELPVTSGKMNIVGKLSYDSQEAFIFSGSLRQNIIFGNLFDKSRYENIIRWCGLEEDLKQLPHGDQTLVGERGVSLSGGQKARVNLARSMYRKADIYLMDDPLAAVDSKVSRQIFEGIKTYLDGSLRILVTHSLNYLPLSDHIIVFDEQGQIQAQGTYEELVSQKVQFICSTFESNNNEGTGDSESEESSSDDDEDEAAAQKLSAKSKARESHGEKMETGSVTWKTYFRYITAGNSKIELVLVVCMIVAAQTIVSFTDKWLSMWTNDVSRKSLSVGPTEFEYSEDTYVLVYSIGVCSLLFLVCSRSVLFVHYTMSISVKLHDKMFESLVKAPVRFFDTNSSGRIINRCTKDMNYVDEHLPPTLNDCVTIFLFQLGIMAVVVTTNYYLIGPCIVLVFVLWKIRKFFIKSARNIKRLDSICMNILSLQIIICLKIAKSPIFLHIAATINGLSTIRGLQAEETVIDQFDSYLDINTSPAYLFIIGNRWFGTWLDILCILFLTSVAASFIFFSSGVEGGNVGMAISLTLHMLGTTQWGLRQSAELENYMTSVERIYEFCGIKPEADLEKKDKPPKNWPSKGSIKFSNVSMSYDSSSKVLKNLNFEIKGNERIGIVGRTGAGKSSIISALFRMTEPEGDIFIDDISIKSLGLHDLRKAISIIPQDPILFRATMRNNLDPFDEYSDEELWRVLKQVNLSDAVPSLEYNISDGGGNFSVGQRQLVCLARSILRRNKIIVLDEATSNIDTNTDEFIQLEIARSFSQCTIITIAHRLNTVINNDRILVMENGSIVEFDTPENLLANPNGMFTMMVNNYGAFSESRKIANG